MSKENPRDKLRQVLKPRSRTQARMAPPMEPDLLGLNVLVILVTGANVEGKVEFYGREEILIDVTGGSLGLGIVLLQRSAIAHIRIM